MRDQTNPEENLAPGIVPKAPWRVMHVQALPGYRLAVRFVDGTAGEGALSHLVTSEQAGVFSTLRDPALFAKVYMAYGAVTWPGGIDLAPAARDDSSQGPGCRGLQ